jgi:hypothetical protein
VSVRLQDQVWRTLDVRGAEKILLLHLADTADDHGGGIFASNEYASWKTGLPERTVKFFRRKWRDMGSLVPVGKMELATQRRVLDPNPRIGRGWVVVYRLDLSLFPRKPSWEEIKKGATIAPFEKGAMTSEKGCKNPRKRVQKRAALIRKIHEVIREPYPSAAEPAPQELIDGFRALVPGISERAVADIWASCRKAVPDCLPDEILELAGRKLERATGIRNSVGLLRACVSDWFEPAQVSELRAERERRAARERERQRQEAEQVEWLRREQAAEERAEHDLAQMEQLQPEKFLEWHDAAMAELRLIPEMRKMPSKLWEHQARLLLKKRLKDELRDAQKQLTLAERELS